jgi:hypothetical protein
MAGGRDQSGHSWPRVFEAARRRWKIFGYEESADRQPQPRENGQRFHGKASQVSS